MSNDSSNAPVPPVETLAGQHTAKQPVRNEAHWGPVAAIAYAVFVYLMAQILGGLLLFAGGKARGWSNQQVVDWMSSAVAGQFWYVLIVEALTFGAIWWFIRWRKSGWQSIGLRKVQARDPVYTFIAFWVYVFAHAAFFALCVSVFPSIDTNQKQELGFDNIYGTIPLIMTFISLVVLPPLVEEIVFRGFMYTGLRRKLKPAIAVLVTSVIFGAAHLQIGSGNPLLWTAAIDTFTLSLVLCYLRQKTDSLWPGIFLHASKNFLAFTVIYILHKG